MEEGEREDAALKAVSAVNHNVKRRCCVQLRVGRVRGRLLAAIYSSRFLSCAFFSYPSRALLRRSVLVSDWKR